MSATSADPLAIEAPEDDDNLYFEIYQPPTPSYEKANSLSFYTLCTRLEIVWEKSRKDTSNKKSKQTLLEFLLPRKLHDYLDGGSPYPLLRLLMPDYDTARPHFGMKEKVIANTWAGAFGLNKQSDDSKKMHHYNNPLASNRGMAYGDLSVVVQEVVAKRSKSVASKVTVGMMNQFLDALGKYASQSSLNTQKNSKDKSKTGKMSLQVQRENWVKKNLFGNRLSPLEHKWLVRIILQKMDIGIGSDGILGYYHPWASQMYDVNKDLCKLCATLSDPIYIEKKKEKIQLEATLTEQQNRMSYMPTSTEAISLGNIITPALSRRTLFRSFLSDISERHRKYINTLPPDSPLRACLSLKFPSFVCEVKMDGERMITHVKNGVLSMHTRQGVWYTNVYAPILGPAVRESMAKYKVDVILDGEIVSWDDGRKEIIPFGNNRTVANCRRDWCERHGKLVDIDMPNSETNHASNVMNPGFMYGDRNKVPGVDLSSADAGESCWLQYVVFDILYVGGEDATKLISDACNKRFQVNDDVKGSIINLPLYQRKAILHHLLTPVENVVEPIECCVIRSDGSQMEGKKYFSSTIQEDYGLSPLVLDSIYDTIEGSMMSLPDRQRVDGDRRRRRTDNDIHDERAIRVQQYFHEIVDKKRQEGTIFKDLASPYAPGASFRKQGYWFKLKLDYENLGEAADLDLIVLGASFATGMRNVGTLSSFLLGCIDDSERRGGQDGKYLTVCSINAGSVTKEQRDRLMELTEFQRGTSLGKWFPAENGQLPNFISKKSFQRSMFGDNSGWKYNAKIFPHVWIDPKDSFVLTVKAAEIVSTEEHSAGISLRFPRIDRVRAKGFEDSKSISDIETVSDLHEKYKEKQQASDAGEDNGDVLGKRKFLSVYQYESSSKNRKRQKLHDDSFYSNKIVNVTTIETNFFAGFSFSVLEGTYCLEEDSIDAEEAKYECWYDSVAKVRSQQDVIRFIKSNGGSVSLGGITSSDVIIGGRLDDARVSNYQRALASSRVGGEKPGSRVVSENLPLFSGVLKWTFIYREQFKAFQMNGSDAYFDLSMKPRKHDFLFTNKGDAEVEDTESCSDLSIFDFKRMLMSEPSSSISMIPWQKRGYDELKDDEQWILSKKLWGMGIQGNGPVIVYPDIFNSFTAEGVDQEIYPSLQSLCSGVSGVDQFEDKLASIPLIKALGGLVTRLLDDSVTHILCDLSGNTCVEWKSNTPISIYSDPCRGRKLHDELRNRVMVKNPLLITTEWVYDQWKSDISKIDA